MERRSFPLDRRTSLRIGGPAERFLAPASEEELSLALRRARSEGDPVRALGGGKNLLVDDEGVRGLVVSLEHFRGLALSGSTIVAGAGVSNHVLLSRAVGAGLRGLECLTGVPGTVGGSLRMNAGGAVGYLGERVRWVRGVTEGGEPFRFSREACGFGYRTSRLTGVFVLEAAFDLEPAPTSALKAEVRRIYDKKRATQPLSAATAGCMFRNPGLPGRESAAFLLQRVGMKGVLKGGARFSPVHANFIENRGDASCRDVLDLLFEGRRRVLDEFGVDLDLEVEIWRRETSFGTHAA